MAERLANETDVTSGGAAVIDLNPIEERGGSILAWRTESRATILSEASGAQLRTPHAQSWALIQLLSAITPVMAPRYLRLRTDRDRR